MNPLLIKNYRGAAPIPGNSFVKIGTGDDDVVTTNTAGEKVFGATTNIPLKTAMGRVDIIHAGIAAIKAGAVIARGANVSTDNQGRAITTPTTGTPVVAGVALEKATAVGDIIRVKLN